MRYYVYKDKSSLLLLFLVVFVGVVSIGVVGAGDELTIEKRDFTNDGTPDIHMSNGEIWARINGEDLSSRTFLSAIGLQDTQIRGNIGFNPRTHKDGNLHHRSTESFNILVDNNELVGCRLLRRYTMEPDGVPFLISHEVYLFKDLQDIIIRTRWVNKAKSKLLLDHQVSHIHDGVTFADAIMLDSPSSPYKFYTTGGGTHNFSSVGRWDSFALTKPDSTPAYLTVYDPNSALTVGLLDGPSGPRHVVSGYRNSTSKLAFLVKQVVARPQKELSYTFALSPHRGGSDAPSIAADLMKRAARVNLPEPPPMKKIQGEPENAKADSYETDKLSVFQTRGNLASRNLRESLESWVKGEVATQLVTSGLTAAAVGPVSLAASVVSLLNKYYNNEYVFPKEIDLYGINFSNKGVYSHYPEGIFKTRGFVGSWKVGDPYYYVILASPKAAGGEVTLSFEKQVGFGENETKDIRHIQVPQSLSNSRLSYLFVKKPVIIYESGVYSIEACCGGRCEKATVELLD